MIRNQPRRFSYEVLEEVALAVQVALKDLHIPHCAFNGGNDVWVDVGNKALGVRALQNFMGGTPKQTLHVGDRFTRTGNDTRAREAANTVWVSDPKETMFVMRCVSPCSVSCRYNTDWPLSGLDTLLSRLPTGCCFVTCTNSWPVMTPPAQKRAPAPASAESLSSRWVMPAVSGLLVLVLVLQRVPAVSPSAEPVPAAMSPRQGRHQSRRLPRPPPPSLMRRLPRSVFRRTRARSMWNLSRPRRRVAKFVDCGRLPWGSCCCARARRRSTVSHSEMTTRRWQIWRMLFLLWPTKTRLHVVLSTSTNVLTSAAVGWKVQSTSSRRHHQHGKIELQHEHMFGWATVSGQHVSL